MTQHRWALVAILRVDEQRGHEIHAMDLDERMRRLHEFFPPVAEGEILTPVETLRGPICSECRVHWRDVFADPANPWPCPGARPRALGGTLAPAEERLTRQQRRAKERQVHRQVAVNAKAPAITSEDELKASFESAVWRYDADRHRVEREGKERREQDATLTEGLAKLGEQLAGVDDLADFLS